MTTELHIEDIQAPRRRRVPPWVWALAGLASIASLALFFGLRRGGDADRTVTQTGAARAGCSGDDDCPARQLCADGSCRAIQAGATECAGAQVHFDTDSAAVRAADQGQLTRMGRCLKADQSMKLTITGSADERGTPEHNVDLGEKRAMAVARALKGMGVSAEQLKIVSYGDQHPLCGEEDAACWAKNRQASLVTK